MIITRAPLRITFAGGGTDLKSYYIGRGTEWLSASIDKYCYTAINKRHDSNYLLKYSNLEVVESVDHIKHNLIREALTLFPIEEYVEITFSADLPGQSGLGSSSSFLVSLLFAIHTYRGEKFTARSVAEEVTYLQNEILLESSGLQDQYIAALGGMLHFSVDALGSNINYETLNLSSHKIEIISDGLLLYFTKITRRAETFLKEQVKKSGVSAEFVSNLDLNRELVPKIRMQLENLDLRGLGESFLEHWNRKKLSHQEMSNKLIDDHIKVALESGALGVKLLGAGGGGFLLYATHKKNTLRESLMRLDFVEVPFRFENYGASVLYAH